METLLTTVGFFVLTGFFIWRHMRESAPSATAQAPAKVVGPPCVRCGATVPSGSQFCPGCGIPQQIFEVVTAGISAAVGLSSGGALKALVRQGVMSREEARAAWDARLQSLGLRG